MPAFHRNRWGIVFLFVDYDAYINSAHWYNLRQQRLILSFYRCEACGNSSSLLHAHHMNYRNLIDCTVHDLVTLCGACHRIVHLEFKRLGKRSMDFSREQTIALIRGTSIRPKKLSKRQRRKHRRQLRRLARNSNQEHSPPIRKGKFYRQNKAIDALAAEIAQREEKAMGHLKYLLLNCDADP